jgi:hypothetical protein
MEWFDTFYLEVEYIMFNKKVDALALSTSTLQPCEDLMEKRKLEIVFKPLISDNFQLASFF